MFKNYDQFIQEGLRTSNELYFPVDYFHPVDESVYDFFLNESYDPTEDRERLEPLRIEIDKKLPRLHQNITNIRAVTVTHQPSNFPSEWEEIIVIRGDRTIKKPYKKTELKTYTYARISEDGWWELRGYDKNDVDLQHEIVKIFDLVPNPKAPGNDEMWIDPVTAHELRGKINGNKFGL